MRWPAHDRGKETIARAGFPAFMSWISCKRAPRIYATAPLITSSSAGANRWLWRRFCGGLLFDVLDHVDQHLGRAQIGAGGFVHHLSDDHLALGDLAPPSVRRDEHRLVQCGD